MLRAALYARYSTGNQSPLSIPAQLRLCQGVAERLGARVDHELADDEKSGFTGAAARPQFHRLLDLVKRGAVDLVIAEHSNRIARDGEWGWHAFNLFKQMGVRYVTAQEGEIGIIQQGVSTMMSELKGEEASLFTRRGVREVVLAGRSGGGLTYGYVKRRAYDAAGEPLRGLLDVDEAQAQVVRRIFRDYASGESPRAIAHALNAAGVSGPRGGPWNASTIHGNAARGVGVLHNELYVGVRVWGRRTFVKDRTSGARRGLPAAAEPVRQDVPELRIVADDLWAAVRDRHARVSTGPMGEGLRGRKRPKRFLQGLIVCAGCGRPMRMAGPRQALRCATRIEKGLCANGRTPGYPGIEARVIAAIQANLLHPAVIEHAIRTIEAGRRQARRETGRRQAKLSAELAEVDRRLERLVDQVEAGAPWAALAARHAALEARRAEISAELAEAPPPDVVQMHPSAAAKYRQLVEDLRAALDAPADPEGRAGRAAVRALIHQVRLTPRPGHGQYTLEIVGDLAPLLTLGAKTQKGPLAGAFDAANVMAELGAGTRVIRRHTLSVPFTQAA